VVVQATVTGPFNNFASVQANESDPSPENNEVTVPGTVETPAGPTPTPPPTPTTPPTPTPEPTGQATDGTAGSGP